ncbi:MAG: FAD-dependent thymidylate synthase [Parcubacteria group bacterium]|nr:FAD-dependent thymidylate synthase [Parcubacteria group bacterium]
MAKAFDEITIHVLAKTIVDREAVRAWLDEMGALEFEIPSEEAVSDPAFLVALSAKQCYMAFQPGLNPNVNKVRSDMVDYLDNVLKQGHGSVLEHAVFTFGINGCSRVFTGEMNRHRAGVGISERSMRYVRYTDIRFWMPECFREKSDDTEDVVCKKKQSRDLLTAQFVSQERMMASFSDIWKEELAPTSTFHAKKVLTSAFRRGIGMGVATGGVWTLNLRALRHVIALRTDASAEEEIVHVFKKIGKIMIAQVPELFGDFKEVNGAFVPEYWKV